MILCGRPRQIKARPLRCLLPSNGVAGRRRDVVTVHPSMQYRVFTSDVWYYGVSPGARWQSFFSPFSVLHKFEQMLANFYCNNGLVDDASTLGLAASGDIDELLAEQSVHSEACKAQQNFYPVSGFKIVTSHLQ